MLETSIFKIGDWVVEPSFNRIKQGAIERNLVPKVMKLLLVLANKQGELVSQDELLNAVWPEQVVSDSSLYQAIAKLRKALGDTAIDPIYIERISGKGYCLLTKIEQTETKKDPDKLTNNRSTEPQSHTQVELGQKTNWRLVLVAILAVIGIAFLINQPVFQSGNTTNTTKSTTIDIKSVTLIELELSSDQIPDSVRALNDILLTQLARINDLKVVHHTQYNRVIKTDAAIRGRITLENDDLRVFLQIEDTYNKEVVWAKLFEGDINHLFDLQDVIVSELLRQFNKTLIASSFVNHRDDDESFQLYLQARDYWSKRKPNSLNKSQQIFERLQKSNRLFPLASVGLCNTYQYQHIYADWSLEQAMTKCEPLLTEALELHPDLGEALAARGLLLSYQNKNILAQEMFERAISNAPNYPFAFLWYGELSRKLGKYPEALKLALKAFELAPNSPIVNRSLAYSYLNLRLVNKAQHYYQRSIELDEHYDYRAVAALDFFDLNTQRAVEFINWANTHPQVLEKRINSQLTAAQIKLSLGLIDQVATLLTSLEDKTVNPSFMLFMRASLATASGKYELAEQLFRERLLLHQNNERFIFPYVIALQKNGHFQQALDNLLKYQPQISQPDISVNLNNHYILATYTQLMNKLFRRSEVAELEEQLDRWFIENLVNHDVSYAQWLLFRGQSDKAKILLLKLMEQGWLPDFNVSVYPQTKMRQLFIESGLGEPLFIQLLKDNRDKVLRRSNINTRDF
ncbi:MAG: winged helix-turn-helix domain-containing protein [Kangiellaceae bacterium]|nr:winged helix-turn-helix domain-containing protein [Kangiellaceae bacterium]